MDKKILITGAGCPGWYGTWRSLSPTGKGIVAVDVSQHVYGYELSDYSRVVPNGNDPQYLDSISKLVDDLNIETIIPLTDPELVPLASSNLPTHVMVSEPEYLKVALNKGKLYSLFPNLSPRSMPLSAIDVDRFISEFSDGDSCWIKLETAHGSRGTKRVISRTKWLESFSTSKPGDFGTTFPIEELRSLERRDNLILVETLPGDEYSIDCLLSPDNELLFYGVRQREKIKNGICDTAKFIVDSDQEFHQFISEIFSALKLKYNINIQVKRDREGKLKLLEINPRISGSLGSFNTLGINLTLMGYELVNNRQIKCPLTLSNTESTRAYRVSDFI